MSSDEAPEDMILSSICLRDISSRCSSIFEDLISPAFRNLLDHAIHHPYHRGSAGPPTIVLVDALSGSSNHSAQSPTTSTIFTLSSIPNRRSEFILGHQAFMASMAVTYVPRSTLVAKGEKLSSREWGSLNRRIHQRSGRTCAALRQRICQSQFYSGLVLAFGLDLVQDYRVFVLLWLWSACHLACSS